MKNSISLTPCALLLFSLINILSCGQSVNESKKPSSEVVEVKPKSTEYNRLKGNGVRLGKWRISNSFTEDSYEMEIYRINNEYSAALIFPSEIKMESLDKEGDKFIVQDNNFGEYYIIDNQNNLSLFDKDGELESTGYKAIKIE